jgi:hypothetical protein
VRVSVGEQDRVRTGGMGSHQTRIESGCNQARRRKTDRRKKKEKKETKKKKRRVRLKRNGRKE